MNKNAPRKLTLNKETVRLLEKQDLEKAAGGTSLGAPCETGTRCNISLCICD